jgi:hypothetical protein
MSEPRRSFEQQTAAKHFENCDSDGTMLQSTSFCDSNAVRPTSQVLQSRQARGDDLLGHKAVHTRNAAGLSSSPFRARFRRAWLCLPIPH